MTLDKTINERLTFLTEQINPKNKPLVNQAIQIQIDTIRSASHDKIAVQVLLKEKELETARDMAAIERIYTELDALQWLQRQIVNYS